MPRCVVCKNNDIHVLVIISFVSQLLSVSLSRLRTSSALLNISNTELTPVSNFFCAAFTYKEIL